MKWIHLGQEYYTCVDDEDYENVSDLLWKKRHNGYAARSRHSDTMLHCFLLGKPPPDKEEIDHINRAPWDNRRSNLRFVTKYENEKNKGIPDSPPFPTEEEKIESKKHREFIKQRNLQLLSEKIKKHHIPKGKNHNSIPVRNSDGQRFPSIKEAGRQLNLNARQIAFCCKGTAIRKCGNMFWEYDFD